LAVVLVKQNMFCFTVLTYYQRYDALLKICFAGTASDSIKLNTSNQGFVLSNRGRLLNQECSSFEESKSFVFDGRLKVLDVVEVL